MISHFFLSSFFSYFFLLKNFCAFKLAKIKQKCFYPYKELTFVHLSIFFSSLLLTHFLLF